MPSRTETNGKRKATFPPLLITNGNSKKSKPNDDPLRQPHPKSQESEDNGIVLRTYYPPEMSTERAQAYKDNGLPRPIELLRQKLEETHADRARIEAKDSVVHWFKCDLRTEDNHALHLASQKAKGEKVPLIAMYIVSPQDFEAHLTAPVRVDFILRTLEVLKEDLAKLDIPLYVETVENRKKIPARILELLQEWGARHVYVNEEYEVDELRRETVLVRACLDKGIAMEVVSDTCIVRSGELQTGSGNQYAVYTPWYRSWVAHVHSNPECLELYDSPTKNPASARKKYADIFKSPIPDTPPNKSLTNEEKGRFRSMWPAGEHEAREQLAKFAKERINNYDVSRNIPGEVGTSSLSVHFASGTLSARSAVRTARDSNTTKKLDGGNQGIQTWISEIAWRDFYKHVMANWPFVCMNKPFKPEYANIEWEYDKENFQAWCEGRTGYPIVDAAMRQLNHCGWMHNRCRMITASFLAKHLLIDWRMGERYFMEHLVDGDMASNNGGWGWSASTGVDPQPYFRIFNPLLQSEKFDSEGNYIRKWVPELKTIKGKAIHEPYASGDVKELAKIGYPKRIVEHKFARERCLQRYKEGIGK
ncbi:putative Deoxyribodipyrimidine photo-lyase [Calycina marina]|uniref:Deoxyribodipyrimidine photo-lyase n=1 Tax=Calycina marina TaxID=1763456 RepID=A0A9P8CC87_9HELO|nr:putative Deoxyribodipyrimidine photo-lyase [Calycina marina]